LDFVVCTATKLKTDNACNVTWFTR
jgi:hypothetical protein